MTSAHEVLDRYRDFTGLNVDAWRSYVVDGEEGARARIAARPHNPHEDWLWEDLASSLPAPTELTNGARRVLRALASIDPASRSGAATMPYVARWLARFVAHAPPDERWLDDVAGAMALGDDRKRALAAWTLPLPSAVRALLALDDAALVAAVQKTPTAALAVCTMVARHAPRRLAALLSSMATAVPLQPSAALLAVAAAVLPESAIPGLPMTGDEPNTACFRAHLAPGQVRPFAERFVSAGERLLKKKDLDAAQWDALRAFVLDARPLGEHARGLAGVDLLSAFLPTLSLPRRFDEAAQRLCQVLVVGRQGPRFVQWADGALRAEAAGEDVFATIQRALADAGVPASEARDLVAQNLTALQSVVGVTSYGRWLLAQGDDELRAILAAQLAPRCWNALAFMMVAQEQPARLPLLVDAIRVAQTHLSHRVQSAIDVLATSRTAAAREAATALDLEIATAPLPPADANDPLRANQRAHARSAAFQAWKRLVARDRAAYLDPACEAARALIGDRREWFAGEAVQWLLRTRGSDARAQLVAVLAGAPGPQAGMSIAAGLVAAFGVKAPEAVAFYLTQPPYLQLPALRRLADDGVSVDDVRIATPLDALLRETHPHLVGQALDLAARDWAWAAPRAWALLSSTSSRVRPLAAARLASHRDEAMWARALALLTHKQAASRLGAVTLLRTLDAAAAARVFEERLDDEGSEDVRDQLLLELQESWRRAGRQVSWADVEQRIAKAKPPRALAPWLDVDKLPPLALSGGRPVPTSAVAWMLARQARVSGVRPDLDAEMLFGLIDRASSGDFALQLLEGFLGGGALANEGFALTVAGRLGDERAAAPLARAVHQWVKEKRGAFAEYGVQALALLGNDAALKAVDDVALRYAQKPKNLGEAATEAFADAAERAGVTIDELRDRIVPWLGFPEDGAPLPVDAGGGKQLALGIDQQFLVTLRDAANGKAVKSLPKTAPDDVKARVKELRTLVRDAAQLQALRLQNLAVVGTRWPLARFRALFLAHPLLVPFAGRLAWTDDAGATFHANHERALVDVDGRPVALADDARVGIAHPLGLDEDVRAAWMARLGEQPFPQLARAVARPREDERADDAWHGVSGSERPTRAMKGASARLGWRRGDSTGGYIGDIHKAFPFADVVAHLDLEDMPVALEMSGTCTVRALYFVRSRGGGRVRLGDVHPIAFSEAVADAQALAGRGPV